MADRSKVWVVLQHRDGKLHSMSREAVAAGQRFAAEAGGSAEAVLLGHGAEAALDGLTALDLGAIRVIDDPALAGYTPGAYVAALAAAVEAEGPGVLVFPHTYQTVDYAPRLAQAISGVMVPEIVGFRRESEDCSSEYARPSWKRITGDDSRWREVDAGMRRTHGEREKRSSAWQEAEK